MSTEWDVIVVGAGMAGLAAARALAQAGLRVLVLEASERTGGRIHTVRAGEHVVELGAEFIHGRPPALWSLIEEAGLETYERVGESWHLRDGNLVPDDDRDDHQPLDELEQFAGLDCSFVEYINQCNLAQGEQQRWIGYVEGFNAADASEMSALALGIQQKAEDAIEGDRLWKLAGGYDQLTSYLERKYVESGGTILLNAEVMRVAWSSAAGVTVSTRDTRVFHAARCLVAVPLGVLQAGSIQFDPGIPNVLFAAHRMRMGQVCRFTLVFRRRLWPESLSFSISPELRPPVWWTSAPLDDHTLTGWSGGPQAEPLLALDRAALREHAIRAAASALALDVEEITSALVSFHTCNWSDDPLARGAYSWVPVGGLDASEQMTRPVQDLLFFAGEHTDTSGHWGTVHAALGSGLRAAEQILLTLPS